MLGMNAETGAPLEGLDHLKQSITDIFNTRIGTRVMRRDYGSDLPNLVDRPTDDELRVDIYIAIAEALNKWEPRLLLQEAGMKVLQPGVIEFSLTAEYLPDGKVISLDGIIVK